MGSIGDGGYTATGEAALDVVAGADITHAVRAAHAQLVDDLSLDL